MKSIVASIAVALGFSGCTPAAPHFTISTADIAAPAQWTEITRTDDRITLSSPDGHQQATISVMRFEAEVTFDDFKQLSELRLDAERKDCPECFFQTDPPFSAKGMFGMYYSGGDKMTGRLFSGYLSFEKQELVVIYIEGISPDPKVHLETFQLFVKGLSRK